MIVTQKLFQFTGTEILTIKLTNTIQSFENAANCSRNVNDIDKIDIVKNM